MDSLGRCFLGHVLPMGVFLALLAAAQGLPHLGSAFVLAHAEFWIYPAQTIFCAALLLWFRRCYPLALPRNVTFGLLAAVIVFLFWIAPQQFFGFKARTAGFDPTLLGNGAIYWLSLAFRFLRLVLVVPALEEVFWRSFLLRFLIDEKFQRVPFGTFRWPSFLIVSGAFALSHSQPDWPAAIIAGALYNLVACGTRSLASCILAHACTNLLLGLWIMRTGQWGFW